MKTDKTKNMYFYFPGTKLYVQTPASSLIVQCPCCKAKIKSVIVKNQEKPGDLEVIALQGHVNKNKREKMKCLGSGMTFSQLQDWIEGRENCELEQLTGHKYIWYRRLKMDEPDTRPIPHKK